MNTPTQAAAPLPFRAIADLVAEHAAQRPRAVAVRLGDAVVDYGTLNTWVDQVAAALQRDGAPRRGAVAICASASPQYLAVFLGALRAGLAAAPLAPSATPQQLADMVADCQAQHLFLDASTAEVLAAVPSHAQAPFDSTAALRGERTLAASADLTQVGQAPTSAPRRITLDGSDFGEPLTRWLTPAETVPQPVAISPDDPFNLIYSSGTTGTPKGIVQPHGMRWGHVQRARNFGYGPEGVTLVATPLYSNTTLVALLPTLAQGGAVVLMPKFDPVGYLTLAQRHRATHSMLVPVQYQRLMDCPQFDDFDLRSFVCKFCTSAPFHADLKGQVLQRWPGGLVEYYGMTEGGGTCILQAHLNPDKLHTVGRPAEGHDIRLIDEQGREVERGGTGEVVGRSGAMMTGYHRQPALTAQAEWHDEQGRRYIRTGDVGRFDDEGFLTLLDRRKDMIISGGFNIYPSDLEAVLRQHPAVADAAVVGVPSARWGETPVAFVVLRAPASGEANPQDEALRAWCNERVGKTQRLADLRCLPELPRSPIGKVLKRELRARYLAPSGATSAG